MQANSLVRVVDDDVSVRRAVAFALKSAGYRVETYDSGVNFLLEDDAGEPGCIVLDYRMPGMDGIEVQRELRARGTDIPVVMITGHGDMRDAICAARAGAVGFIEKPFTNDDLLTTVAAALQLDAPAGNVKPADRAPEHMSMLTAREREVLTSLADAVSNKVVARRLDISWRTVESHRANIFRKLGARDLAEALELTNMPIPDGIRVSARRHSNRMP